MAEESPKKTVLGYVSAYLKQTLRTYAEAEQDRRAQNPWPEIRDTEVAADFETSPGAAHSAANEK
jgi:hypothetical protein